MFGKVFASTFTGSMMGAGSHVFAAWMWILANADADGNVEINPRLLAALIGESEERISDALAYLSAPDPDSRTGGDGRRIRHIEGFLWEIANHAKYRAIRSSEARREQNREAQRRWRERKSAENADRKQSSASDAYGKQNKPKTEDRRQKTEVVKREVALDPAANAASRVWDHMNALRASLSPNSRGLKLTKKARGAVVARLGESSEADALAVLDMLAAECRRDPGQVRWFQGATIFRHDNYHRSLGRVGDDGAGVTRTGLEDFDVLAARKQLDALCGRT